MSMALLLLLARRMWMKSSDKNKNGRILGTNYDGSVKEEWFLNGKLHREGGPARIIANNYDAWYRNGELHREGGPAVIWAHGKKEWFLNGKRHRLDGPAIIFAEGAEYWFKNNELHREDGPAIYFIHGEKQWLQWWLNGFNLTKEEWWERLPHEMKVKALFNGEGL